MQQNQREEASLIGLTAVNMANLKQHQYMWDEALSAAHEEPGSEPLKHLNQNSDDLQLSQALSV